ncbi:pyridoxamine 5'-phosphate oxidase family protein [Patescibacteria group bacterium]|nr:pyridoxamine 5'-phosphate oxidase family protein [Patescibacteria group bacterium]
MKDLDELAREIIETNQYMTLGTSDGKGSSWVAPLAYAHDKNWNMYFVSLPDSRHSSDLKKNNEAVVAIFDSHQAVGEGVGLQIEGIIKETNIKNIPLAAKTYFSKKYPYGRNMKEAFASALRELLDGKVYRFYQFTPTNVWMNDPNAKTDVRVEVHLH